MLDEIEQVAVTPIVAAKTFIALVWLYHRLSRTPEQTRRGLLPQGNSVLPELPLGLGQLLRFKAQRTEVLEENLTEFDWIETAAKVVGLILHKLGHSLLAAGHDIDHGAGKFCRISCRWLGFCFAHTRTP